ncbi:hypothetical protein Mjas_00600 [Methanothermococcus sp. Ax23]
MNESKNSSRLNRYFKKLEKFEEEYEIIQNNDIIDEIELNISELPYLYG